MNENIQWYQVDKSTVIQNKMKFCHIHFRICSPLKNSDCLGGEENCKRNTENWIDYFKFSVISITTPAPNLAGWVFQSLPCYIVSHQLSATWVQLTASPRQVWPLGFQKMNTESIMLWPDSMCSVQVDWLTALIPMKVYKKVTNKRLSIKNCNDFLIDVLFQSYFSPIQSLPIQAQSK